MQIKLGAFSNLIEHLHNTLWKQQKIASYANLLTCSWAAIWRKLCTWFYLAKLIHHSNLYLALSMIHRTLKISHVRPLTLMVIFRDAFY